MQMHSSPTEIFGLPTEPLEDQRCLLKTLTTQRAEFDADATRTAPACSGGDLGAARTGKDAHSDAGRVSPFLALCVVIALAILSACSFYDQVASTPDRSPDAHVVKGHQSEGPVSSRQLRTALATVQVAPAADAVPNYDRSEFGPDWTDEHRGLGGHNDCDTRNDVLARDLVHVGFDPGSDCEIASGVLTDPYTGEQIKFDADLDPNAVQIEHIYPLSLAWHRGAYAWADQRRVDFANDIQRNLIAVDGPTNMSKGDDSPSEWLPPNKNYRCEYLYRFLKVAAQYDLPISAADADAVKAQAPACPVRSERRG